VQCRAAPIRTLQPSALNDLDTPASDPRRTRAGVASRVFLPSVDGRECQPNTAAPRLRQ